jgi:hypothetical protein
LRERVTRSLKRCLLPLAILLRLLEHLHLHLLVLLGVALLVRDPHVIKPCRHTRSYIVKP